jgi:hypothetical protein
MRRDRRFLRKHFLPSRLSFLKKEFFKNNKISLKRLSQQVNLKLLKSRMLRKRGLISLSISLILLWDLSMFKLHLTLLLKQLNICKIMNWKWSAYLCKEKMNFLKKLKSTYINRNSSKKISCHPQCHSTLPMSLSSKFSEINQSPEPQFLVDLKQITF